MKKGKKQEKEGWKAHFFPYHEVVTQNDFFVLTEYNI